MSSAANKTKLRSTQKIAQLRPTVKTGNRGTTPMKTNMLEDTP